jgi:hypothetical protein
MAAGVVIVTTPTMLKTGMDRNKENTFFFESSFIVA